MRRVLVLLTACLLAGCASGETVRQDSRAVAIDVADFRYAPQDVSVPRGQVFFAVRNAGVRPTSFVLRRGRRERGRVSTLQPGEVGTLAVRLGPGEYVMGSATGRHEVLGQRGTLTVR